MLIETSKARGGKRAQERCIADRLVCFPFAAGASGALVKRCCLQRADKALARRKSFVPVGANDFLRASALSARCRQHRFTSAPLAPAANGKHTSLSAIHLSCARFPPRAFEVSMSIVIDVLQSAML